MAKVETNKNCCVCGKKIYGYGNNPYPIYGQGEVCCDDCNTTVVIPKRLQMLNPRYRRK